MKHSSATSQSSAYADQSDAELIAYGRVIVAGMKANGYAGILWDEMMDRFEKTLRSEIATPDRAEISRKSAESMEASETMLPCPSCGETDVDATFAQGHDNVNAGCMVCGMMGPDSHTAKDAADRWNALPRSPRSATADKTPWILTGKELPDHGNPVIVYQGDASHTKRVAYYDTIGATGWHWCDIFYARQCAPEAWMPIPEFK